MKPLRRAAGAACLLFALLRASMILGPAAGKPPEKNLAGYSHMGEILTHGISAEAELVSYRMPLATVVLARLDHHVAARTAVLVFGYRAALLLLLFALGCLLHPYGAFLAALACAALTRADFDPNLYPDMGYNLLVLLAAGLLVWRARAPSPRRSALLAAAVGATLLWRSPLAFFTPLLALYEWAFERRFPLKERRKQLVILCLVPYLFLLPWIAMNWTVHRRIVIFERQAASANIVTGALGLVEDVEGDHSALVDEPLDMTDTSAVLRWAGREVLRHPLRFTRAYVLRLRYAFAGHPWLALFAAASVFVFRKRRDYRELALLCAYYVGIHCFMSVETRYFWPLWPMVAMLACSLPAAPRAQDVPAPGAPEPRFAAAVLLGALGIVMALTLFTHGLLLSFASRARRGGGAEEQLSDALRSNPDDAWLLGERGKTRLLRGDGAGAAADFSRAAALEPEDLELRLQDANAEALLGKPARLLAWENPPEHEDLQIDSDILKACAYLRLGRGTEALARLKAAQDVYAARNILVRGTQGEQEKRALDALRTFDSGFAGKCRNLQGSRPVEEKLALNEALAKLAPQSSAVWLERALLEARAGRRDEALKALARAETLKLSPAAQTRLALQYGDLKQYDRAYARMQAVLRRSPPDADLLLIQAGFAAELGKREEALAFLARGEALPLSDGQRRNAALLYWRLKNIERASILLAGLVRSSPADASLLIERARLAVQMRRNATALESLARAEQQQLDEEQQRLVIALYRQLKDFRRAAAVLEALSRKRPLDAGVWLLRAETEAEMGAREAALQSLARAGTQTLDEAQSRLAAALLAGLLSERASAAELTRASAFLDALIRRFPADADLRVDRARLAARMGDRNEALDSLARARGLDADQLRRVAALYLDLKDPRRASAALETLSRQRPLDAGVWLSRAEAAAETGARSSALEFLAKAGTLTLDDAQSRRAVALQVRLLGERPINEELKRAAVFLDELIRRRPEDAWLRLDRAELALKAGEPGAARKALGSIQPMKLDDAAQRRAAGAYAALKDYGPALSLMDGLTRRAPEDGQLWLERASLEARGGARAASLASLARAEALAPGGENRDDEQRRRIALAYQDMKEYDRAVGIFALLTRQHPAAASFHADKALCEYLKGDERSALADLRTAVEVEPKFLPSYLTLAAIHASAGRAPQALAVYDDALSKTGPADPLRAVLLAARKDLLAKNRR